MGWLEPIKHARCHVMYDIDVRLLALSCDKPTQPPLELNTLLLQFFTDTKAFVNRPILGDLS